MTVTIEITAENITVKHDMADSASFDPADVQAVYGPSPACVHTSLKAHDLHHIIGRGYDFGIRPAHELRFIFSSMLNCIPLTREIHNGPMRDTPMQRAVYLQVAYRHFMNAVGVGSIHRSEADVKFQHYAETWLLQNQLPFVYVRES